MQDWRRVQGTVALKLKLNYEERTFVENNRFPKLRLRDSGSEEDKKSSKSYATVKSRASEGGSGA